MATWNRWGLGLSVVLLLGGVARGQTLRVSFDAGVKADRAAGRAEPWVSKGVELVPGKFGKAARVGPSGPAHLRRRAELPGRPRHPRLLVPHPGAARARSTCSAWSSCSPRSAATGPTWRRWNGRSRSSGRWSSTSTTATAGTTPPACRRSRPDTWHHVALVWDQAQGVEVLPRRQAGRLDLGQAGLVGAADAARHPPVLSRGRLRRAVRLRSGAERRRGGGAGRGQPARRSPRAGPPCGGSRRRLLESLRAVGLRAPADVIDLGEAGKPTRSSGRRVVRQILDDRIPAWKVMDGRMNLFWPEWRGAGPGRRRFQRLRAERGSWSRAQKLTHLVLRGLVGGCRVFGERGGYVSREPIARRCRRACTSWPPSELPADLTGLRIPRREGMKLQEIGPVRGRDPADASGRRRPSSRRSPGPLDLAALGTWPPRSARAPCRTSARSSARRLPRSGRRMPVAAPEPGPLRQRAGRRGHCRWTPSSLRLTFSAPWKERRLVAARAGPGQPAARPDAPARARRQPDAGQGGRRSTSCSTSGTSCSTPAPGCGSSCCRRRA